MDYAGRQAFSGFTFQERLPWWQSLSILAHGACAPRRIRELPTPPAFRAPSPSPTVQPEKEKNEALETKTPLELIEEAHGRINEELVANLQERVRKISPEAFERLTLDLLDSMRYGSPIHNGKPGDEGIDGIINEDALGLSKIYIQAKRWKERVLL